MSKKTIAIDIDDVLSDNAEGFVAYSNEHWGLNLTVDDYNEHWGEMWKTEREETERRAVEFHLAGVVGQYMHKPSAEPVLKNLAQRYELAVVTSRRKSLVPETEAWLKRYFPGIFSSVHYAGMYDNGDPYALLHTKAELVRGIGADYLIDDQTKHCFAAAEEGIKAVLYGLYPWNRSDDLPAGVTRCMTWMDVAEYFAGEEERHRR